MREHEGLLTCQYIFEFIMIKLEQCNFDNYNKWFINQQQQSK